MTPGSLRALALAACALLAACGGRSEPAQGLQLKAETALPPGQSGLVTADGQAAGQASCGQPSGCDPGAYGANLDDQRTMYWSFAYKDGSFDRRGTPVAVPRAGIEVFLDPYGVPAVYADTVFDLWYGVGYVAAQQRLFIMDAVRRLGRGTAAELLGCAYVPDDIQVRTLGYTAAEYQQFLERMHPDSQAAFQGYAAGANAWLDALATTQSDQMPAEYGLLGATPAPFEVTDLLAAGVLMVRRVAVEGGDEFFNIHMLRELEQAYGRDAGRAMFLDLVWDEDRKAATTVPAGAEFPNTRAADAAARETAFHARADWALTLPDTVWLGPGTGGAPEPAPCEAPAEDGTTAAASAATVPLRSAGLPTRGDLLGGLRQLRGGSWAVAIGRARTRDRGALLISAPQLGYTYPSYLWEAEIHGAGYEARGVSVAGLPVIGIGYTPHVAWALTTGYSKNIDSFIETTCSTAQAQAGACAANQYFHRGAWRDMDCRTESIPYRASSQGLPTGEATFSVSHEVCRTAHGPLVARDDGAGLARALSYATFLHEVDTVEGVREWSRARNAADFLAATALVSWNENVTFATRDGDIGYVHPGRYPDRHPGVDQRFPTPGTGEFDFLGWLPFERMPRAINPGEGWLANWNNKPALGWLDGEGISVNSRPAGPGQRVTILQEALASRSGWTYEDLKAVDRIAGTRDPRAREYLPVFEAFHRRSFALLDDGERHALALLLSWDRSHYGPDVTLGDPASRDTAAATLFDAWVRALRADLFGELDQYVLYAGDRDLDADGDREYAPIDPDTDEPPITIYNRSKAVGSHRFDQSVMDNVIVRIFDPAHSSLPVRHDWLRGRDADAVLLGTLRQALAGLAQQYGAGQPPTAAEVDTFRRAHPQRTICSLTGVIGPGSTTPSGECVKMPYQDRGSWVHLVGYEKP